MLFDQSATIAADVEAVWAFVTDIPDVSRCVPGLEEFELVEEPYYRGVMSVRVGPIGVRLQGQISITEQDKSAFRSVISLKATEHRIHSTVSATTTLTLEGRSNCETTMRIQTDAAILGKLGEFGQAVLRRKADQILEEFSRNVSQRLGSAEHREAPMASPAQVGLGRRLIAWLQRFFAGLRPGKSNE